MIFSLLLFVGVSPLALGLTSAQAEESAPTLWRFAGPLAEQLPPIFKELIGPQHGDQRLSVEAIDAFLKQAPLPREIPCLDDRNLCPAPRASVLIALGAAGLITVHASTEDGRYVVKLDVSRGRPLKRQRHQSVSTSLREACEEVLGELFSLAQLSILGLPTGAKLSVDGRPVQLTGGRASLSPGVVKIRIEAPHYVPFEKSLTLQERRLTELEVQMLPSWSILRVELTPVDAKLTLDGREIKAGAELRIEAGTHQLAASAPDYMPYAHTFDTEPGREYDYRVTLPLSRAPWKLALREGHAALDAGPQRIQIQLRYGVATGGEWGAQAEYKGGKRDLRRILGPLELSGFDFSLQERHRWLQWEWVGVSYDVSGDETQVVLEPDPGRQQEPANAMTDYSRLSLRALQVGVNLPLWRVNPYLQLGLAWVWEKAELVNHGALTHQGLRLRSLGGVRYAFDDGLFVDLGGAVEAWDGERSVVTVLLGAGYGLDLYRL
ncbi:MAG: PEGA domain-containing protein [Myxococcota bacterium]|nr:PEGA domain-containing protein [Myxococcota bacterium]